MSSKSSYSIASTAGPVASISIWGPSHFPPGVRAPSSSGAEQRATGGASVAVEEDVVDEVVELEREDELERGLNVELVVVVVTVVDPVCVDDVAEVDVRETESVDEVAVDDVSVELVSVAVVVVAVVVVFVFVVEVFVVVVFVMVVKTVPENSEVYSVDDSM